MSGLTGAGDRAARKGTGERGEGGKGGREEGREGLGEALGVVFLQHVMAVAHENDCSTRFLAVTLFLTSCSMVWLYHEMRAKLSVEMDFRVEMLNAARLREILEGPMRGHSAAYVPKMLDHLCTERLVVMEWIQVCI